MNENQPIKEKEIEFVVTKKDGTPRKQWQENKLGRLLQIKIPYITGRYRNKVNIKLS